MQSKLLATGLTLCVIATVGLFGKHLDTERMAQAIRDQQHWDSLGRGLPSSPAGVLKEINGLIAKKPDRACWMFAEETRPQVATAYGEPDCATAMHNLNKLVTNKNKYYDFDYSYSGDQWIRDQDGYMDGCAIKWNNGIFDEPGQPDPGPRIGKMWMRRVANQGFWVTRFERCPPEASKTFTPAPATTTTTTTPLLPSYAPNYPAVLVGRIATRDHRACEFFKPQGKNEFATANGEVSCAATIEKLSSQISDPQRYGTPLATAVLEKPGPNGTVLVDGCSMEWPGGGIPGPKIGQLTLERLTNGTGYLIVGYKSC